jgi:hypothetical protein
MDVKIILVVKVSGNKLAEVDLVKNHFGRISQKDKPGCQGKNQ